MVVERRFKSLYMDGNKGASKKLDKSSKTHRR
jgi:hypothetical protein